MQKAAASVMRRGERGYKGGSQDVEELGNDVEEDGGEDILNG